MTKKIINPFTVFFRVALMHVYILSAQISGVFGTVFKYARILQISFGFIHSPQNAQLERHPRDPRNINATNPASDRHPVFFIILALWFSVVRNEIPILWAIILFGYPAIIYSRTWFSRFVSRRNFILAEASRDWWVLTGSVFAIYDIAHPTPY